MKSKNIMVSLVALAAMALVLLSSVSATDDIAGITSIEVKGIEGTDSTDIAVFAGETLPVRITFEAFDFAEDVRVKAWIAGDREYSVASERFDVLEGRMYSRYITVQVPFDIDPEEELKLMVVVESKEDGLLDEEEIDLAAQRESYIVEILDVDTASSVKAGNSLTLDIVLKNRGRHFAEDTFVKASIPALGIEEKSYFGDLSPVDQGNDDERTEDDAAERRMFLDIPSNVPAGVYVVELEAYNSDSTTTLTRKVTVVGAGQDSIVVSPVHTRTFGSSESGSYTLTLVNSGNRVLVYELVVDAPEGISVDIDEPIVAIPAGSSKTVRMDVSAEKAGMHEFTVNVHSDGQLVKTEKYVANVQGSRAIAGTRSNTTVLLTVILAIIFVVLLVVLIVLLTRKPTRNEEFGESYY